MTSVDGLNILYQDELMVAVDKPAGHLVHPADNPQEGDQVVMKNLRDQIGQHVNPIHRLDRPTTGVLLFGLTPYATKRLRRAFDHHHVTKTYRCLCHGTPPASVWECHEPLRKTEGAPLREAHTAFELVQSFMVPVLEGILSEPTLHLVDVNPSTGRFHQIRRHLAGLQLPIVGDYRYAGMAHSEALSERLGLDQRMLLQAHRLEFPHPVTGDAVSIQAPIDPYFLKVCPTME